MSQEALPFGHVQLLREDIAEVIIDEGVEMDLNMVKQYHQYLLDHLKAPFSVLVNKRNAYTYTFEAQQALSALSQSYASAVVVYSRLSHISTDYVISLPHSRHWNINLFSNRQEALQWLIHQQDQALSKNNNN